MSDIDDARVLEFLDKSVTMFVRLQAESRRYRRWAVFWWICWVLGIIEQYIRNAS